MSKLPVICSRVYGSEEYDLYFDVGEPIGVGAMCADGAEALFGGSLDPLASRQVELEGRFVE